MDPRKSTFNGPLGDRSDSTLNSLPLPQSRETLDAEFFGTEDEGYLERLEVDGPGSSVTSEEYSEEDTGSKSKGGYNTANPFSKVFWCWLDPLLCTGLRKELEQDDLYDPPKKATTEALSEKFERYWKEECIRGRNPSLFRVIFKMLWLKMVLHFLLSALKLTLQVGQAIIVGLLSEYFVLVNPADEDTRDAYLYALGLSLVVLLSAFIHNHGFLQAQEIGMLSRIICTNAIYRKILKLDQKTLGEFTLGKILNLASNDVRKLDFAFLYSPYLILAPLHLLSVFFLLYFYTGLRYSCLAGLILFIIWIPLQWGLSKIYAILRLKAANCTDTRVQMMNDIITGIRVIKMYAWENAFKKVISDVRGKEIKYILLSALFRACNDGFFLVSIAWFNLLTFSVYVNIPDSPPLSPTIVYTSIALVTGLRLSTMVYMVESIIGVQDARIALKRIQEFLSLEAHPLTAIHLKEQSKDIVIENGNQPKQRKVGISPPTIPLTFSTSAVNSRRGHVLLSVNDISATWNNDSKEDSLQKISFTVKKGQVVSIIGPVGSGKTSLLQAIMGELPLTGGSVEANGLMAYTSQEPWVFGGTMRDNILFGEPFEEDWYNDVTEVCCLTEDIDKLPYGDLSLVGERGVSLSGGQRARVNLARSVYKKGSIYLLDDPLSAVDPGIEHHIFDQCITDILDDCAVLLVTHQLSIARMTDHVIVMHKGRAIAQGSFDEILEIAEHDADTPLGRDLYEVFREFISVNTGEEDIEDVFEDSRPSTPEEPLNPLRRRPNRLPSINRPKLIKRVTDLAMVIPRHPSVRLTPKLEPGVHSVQNTSRLRRKSTTHLLGERFLQRRSTVAACERGAGFPGLKMGISLKELKGGPLATLAASRDDYKVDEDNLDYSVFAGGNPHYHTRIYTQKSINRLSMASTPNTPGTPSRKKSMATYLANQLPESLIEEDENQESGSDTNITPPQPLTSVAEDEEEKESPDDMLEDKGHGGITMKTYYRYFIAGSGYVLGCIVLLLFLVSQSALILGDWWLAIWAGSNTACSVNTTANATSPSEDFCYLEENQRIGIYAGLVGSSTLLAFFRAILFFYICLRAAKKLHNITFGAVLHMPTRFFDINPIGRILNRFSKDIGFLDDILPMTFYDYLTIMLHFLAIMIFASVANWLIIFPMLLLIAVFLAMRFYYLRSSQEIKRLEAIVRSPLYSHISNTLLGLNTIHTLQKESMFIEWFNTYQDENTKGWSAYITSTRWFGLRVDVFSALFISIVAFSAIPLATVGPDLPINNSLIGLSLVYCISLSGVFQYGVRLSTEVESLMVSAERLIAYGKFPSEASLDTILPHSKPSKDWPHKGVIKMQGLKFRYKKTGPYVLKEITCKIEAAEKIGIVGRSGAGKSSILSALFRLSEPEGTLEIDEIQITDIGLHDLRSKISIIPQDPILFSGTVRYNLDPLKHRTDVELWNALEKVQLKAEVESLPFQLSSEVSEGGSNFSTGQRQLICLARAILQKNRILVIDEATANVDMTTDSIIQNIIRTEFEQCTVLTVAHRLHTVMDSDRIMVLDFGRIKEFDEPHTLLQNPSSILSFMISKVGEEDKKKLLQIARDAHKKRKRAKRKKKRTVKISSAPDEKR